MNGETPEQFTTRMMDKADDQRRFRDQDRKAVVAACKPRPKKAVRQPKAPPRPRVRPPKVPTEPRRRDARPEFCRCCARRLRGRSQSATPDTRAHGGRGYCVSCYRNGGEKPRPYGVQQGDLCTVCGVPMFTRSKQPQPGQRRHAGRGECSTCYSRTKRAA